MENNFRRIPCKNCGGIMSPDQRTHSFQCPWCESRLSWNNAGYSGWPAPWRHKPLTRVEGLLKLGHVEIMEVPTIPLWDDPLGTAETLRRWGTPGAEAISGSWKGAVPCPVWGNMAQVPESALPYRLTLENAHTVLQGLCTAFSQELGQVAEVLHQELAPVYLPFSLADLRVKAEVSTEKGKGLVYQETQDWACPENSLFDIRVLDRLEPWNFDEILPFDPAFCERNQEENIRIVAPSNLQPRGRIIDALLYDRVRDGVMDGFGARKVDILRWSYDFHKLDHIGLLLPIFFAETPPDSWGNRIAAAINGQTGAAAACLRLREGKRTMMTGRGVPVPELSEHTIRTPAVAVRRVRSPFLHEILPPEKAFRKRGLFW